MKKYTDFNAATKAFNPAAVTTITFTGSDIPGPGVVAYHLYMTGDNTFADLTRIRLKANGETIWDVDPGHYRTFVERMSRSNFAVPTAGVRFTIPLYHMDAKGDDRYLAQFPQGATPTIEIVVGAGIATGSMVCGYSMVDAPPTAFVKLLGSQMNIAAGATNGTYPIMGSGFLRGYSLNTTGLNRKRLILNGVQRDQTDGTIDLEQDQLESPQTITNPLFHKLHGVEEIFSNGRSQLYIDSAGGWAGTANELTTYTIHPYSK